MCTSSNSSALQPHFHFGHLDPFQPWDDEPQLASGHCSADLYGHYLCGSRWTGQQLANVVGNVVKPIKQPQSMVLSFIMWIHVGVWQTPVNHIPLKWHQVGFALASRRNPGIPPAACAIILLYLVWWCDGVKPWDVMYHQLISIPIVLFLKASCQGHHGGDPCRFTAPNGRQTWTCCLVSRSLNEMYWDVFQCISANSLPCLPPFLTCFSHVSLRFYSMGDSKVFMALQVYCRNGEALGGSMAGLLGTALFTVDPVAPFAFSTAFACGSEKPP